MNPELIRLDRPRAASHVINKDVLLWASAHGLVGIKPNKPRSKIPRFRKIASVAIFGDKCFWCPGKVESFDHFIPRCHGGRKIPRNLVPCCFACNKSHGAKLPDQDDIARWQAAMDGRARKPIGRTKTGEVDNILVAAK